ncbi:DUF2474 domain-containing protein [Sphingobium sp. Leaf26]|nr:DUF2474 domain-containing protein [Sphingobium sp. Leaf26]
MPDRVISGLRRLGWLIAIWSVSVTALGIVAFIIRKTLL